MDNANTTQKHYQKIIDSIPYGKDNAIHMNDLAILFDLKPRIVRQAILDARMDGEIILSNIYVGYWKSDDEDELLEFLSSAKGRALTTLRYCSQMNKKRGGNSNV